MTETNPSLINWPEDRPYYTSFDTAVQGEVARWNAIGMAGGVIRDGQRTIAAHGWAHQPAGYRLLQESLFAIGSISKVYTTTLVLRLVEQGRLDLDTPVVQYIPDFRLTADHVRDAITLRMLLSHTSGFEGDRFIAYGRGDDAYDKSVAEFHTLTQWYQPGSFYAYNNAGFYLVGHVIQKATGKSFEDVITEELFVPMGLKNTVIQPEDALNRSFAPGHLVKRTEGVTLHPGKHIPRHAHPAGGVLQSVGDLLTFAEMHLNLGKINGMRIISEEHAHMMQEPIVEADAPYRSYGLGWSIYERPEFKSVGHGGAWGGHRANLLLIPEYDFAYAALTNSNAGPNAYESVEKWVLQHELGVTPSRPDAIELSPEELSAHCGTYTRHDGEFVVELHGTGLRATVTDIDEDTGDREATVRLFDMEPLTTDRFRITSPESRGGTVDFRDVPDADGIDQHLMRMWGRVAKRS